MNRVLYATPRARECGEEGAQKLVEVAAAYFTHVDFPFLMFATDDRAGGTCESFEDSHERIEDQRVFEWMVKELHARGVKIGLWWCVGPWDTYKRLVHPFPPEFNLASRLDCNAWLDFDNPHARAAHRNILDDILGRHPVDVLSVDYCRHGSSKMGLPSQEGINAMVRQMRELCDDHSVEMSLFCSSNPHATRHSGRDVWKWSSMVDSLQASVYGDELTEEPARFLEEMSRSVRVVPIIKSESTPVEQFSRVYEQIKRAGFAHDFGVFQYGSMPGLEFLTQEHLDVIGSLPQKRRAIFPYIARSEDDACATPYGRMEDLDAELLALHPDWMVGVRFSGWEPVLPEQIEQATLQLYAYSPTSNTGRVMIRGQVGPGEPFTEERRNLHDRRPQTASMVQIELEGELGWLTFDVTGVVREMAETGGDTLILIGSDPCDFHFRSRDYGPQYAPRLNVYLQGE